MPNFPVLGVMLAESCAAQVQILIFTSPTTILEGHVQLPLEEARILSNLLSIQTHRIGYLVLLPDSIDCACNRVLVG